MPQYNVTARGFFDGILYDPVGKHRVLTTDKPFTVKNIPSWVEPKAISTARAAPTPKGSKVPEAPVNEPDFESDAESDVVTM